MSSPLCSGDSKRFLGFPNTPSCFWFLPFAHSRDSLRCPPPRPYAFLCQPRVPRYSILRHFPRQPPFPESLGSSRNHLHAPWCTYTPHSHATHLRLLTARTSLHRNCVFMSPPTRLGAPRRQGLCLVPCGRLDPCSVLRYPCHRIHCLCHHHGSGRLSTDFSALMTAGLGMGFAQASGVSRGFECAWVV